MFDELAVAQSHGQALIGSVQTYCIRATAEIGCDSNKYESAPTCTDITIAWESSVSGFVLGRQNTGNAPIAGVSISWYFLDYPDISGTGITNANGEFVESSGAIGLNIQVCQHHYGRRFSSL